MNKNDSTLKRREIRAVFRRHRGIAARVARELGVADTTMSHWLKGHFDSKRIEAAALPKAMELLAEERTQNAA